MVENLSIDAAVAAAKGDIPPPSSEEIVETTEEGGGNLNATEEFNQEDTVEENSQEIGADSETGEDGSKEEADVNLIIDDHGNEIDLSGVPKNLKAYARRQAEAAKKAKTELETERQKAIQAQQNLSMLMDRFQQQPVQPQPAQQQQQAPQFTEAEPDVVLDPEGHTNWMLRKESFRREQLERQVNEMRGFMATQHQQQQQAAQVQGALNMVSQAEGSYAQSNPNYFEAKKFVVNNEVERIKALNPGVTNEQAEQQVNNWILEYAVAKERQGIPLQSIPENLFNEVLVGKVGGWTSARTNASRVNHEALERNKEKSKSVGNDGGTGERFDTKIKTVKQLEALLKNNPKKYRELEKKMGQGAFFQFIAELE